MLMKFCLDLLISLTAIYLLIYSCSYEADYWSKCHARLISEAEKFAARYRACLLKRLQENDTKIWNQVESAIDSCLNQDSFTEYLDMRQLGESGNTKTAILPPSINSSCSVAVANRYLSSAETDLFKHAPQCRFHKAIGNTKLKDFLNGWYTNVALEHYDRLNYAPFHATVKTFLEKISKVPFVDYFWMDSLGTNLGVLAKTDGSGTFVAHPRQVFHMYSIVRDPINVTVCQVYFDTPLVSYSTLNDVYQDILGDARSLFPKLLHSIIANSSFLPLHANMKKYELDTFYFNISNPNCVDKFLARKFCPGKGLWYDFMLRLLREMIFSITSNL